MELFGTSMSSATITSAREPASWPDIPTDFTEGACDAAAGATSKLIFDCLWPQVCQDVHLADEP